MPSHVTVSAITMHGLPHWLIVSNDFWSVQPVSHLSLQELPAAMGHVNKTRFTQNFILSLCFDMKSIHFVYDSQLQVQAS